MHKIWILQIYYRVHKNDCLLFKGFFLNHLPLNIRTHLMREVISNPRKLAAKADEIWQSSFARSVNTVSPTLFPVLLLVLLHPLFVLQLRPPPRPLTSAGIILNMETKLNIAVLLFHGFRETS